MFSSEARPLILVTGPAKGGRPAWWCMKFLIRWAGGSAKRVSPAQPEIPQDYSAVILSGGADVHPERYREQILPAIKSELENSRGHWARSLFSIGIWLMRRWSGRVAKSDGIDLERDRLEWRILESAMERRAPILGICRGSQLINVYFGGTLHQDITGFYTETPYLRTMRPRKSIEVAPGSILSDLVSSRSLRVNALHRQSVKGLGAGLRISARESNGVIQAIEKPDYPFLLGVQWHPEFLPFLRNQRRLFLELVQRAKKGPARPIPLTLA